MGGDLYSGTALASIFQLRNRPVHPAVHPPTNLVCPCCMSWHVACFTRPHGPGGLALFNVLPCWRNQHTHLRGRMYKTSCLPIVCFLATTEMRCLCSRLQKAASLLGWYRLLRFVAMFPDYKYLTSKSDLAWLSVTHAYGQVRSSLCRIGVYY